MKKLIIGLVVGLLIGISSNAFAAISDTVQATFANFNYVVNGVAQPPGVTALVYDGTSYLKTTQIANMLGYDVVYRADSRTIEFNKPTPSPTLAPITTPTVTGVTYTPTPTALPSPTPSGPTPTPNPNATPAPSVAPTPTPNAGPTPAPTPYQGQTNEHITWCRQYQSDPVMYNLYGCNQ